MNEKLTGMNRGSGEDLERVERLRQFLSTVGVVPFLNDMVSQFDLSRDELIDVILEEEVKKKIKSFQGSDMSGLARLRLIGIPDEEIKKCAKDEIRNLLEQDYPEYSRAKALTEYFDLSSEEIDETAKHGFIYNVCEGQFNQAERIQSEFNISEKNRNEALYEGLKQWILGGKIDFALKIKVFLNPSDNLVRSTVLKIIEEDGNASTDYISKVQKAFGLI